MPERAMDNELAVVPVKKTARSTAPGDDPASTRYDVGAPPALSDGAAQVNVTVDPAIEELNAAGAAGAGVGPPSWTIVNVCPAIVTVPVLDARLPLGDTT